jgi:3-oxoadipate enol-lactonase
VIIERDGVALNVAVEGEGAPVVLLHGHSLDLRTWDDLASVLVGHGFRVVRYDQRGHGRSASPPGGYRWGDHADDLDAVLAATDSRPAHLVGLSKGGGIALEAALRRPDSVRSLLFVGPLVPDVELAPELLGSFREFARLIRREGPQAAVERYWLAHPLIASAHAHPGSRERVEAMTLAFPAGEYLASQRDPVDRPWRVDDRLGEIGVPTLVVVGSQDVAEFRAMARLVAQRVRNGRLEVVDGSGHLVPLERPEAFADLALRFVAGQQG